MRTSNWEATLSTAQKTYAANDAHCALTVYNTLLALAEEHQREIRWEECSSDLAEVYHARTATAGTTAVAAPKPAAVPQEEEESDHELVPSTPATNMEVTSSVPAALSRTASTMSNCSNATVSRSQGTVYAGELPGSTRALGSANGSSTTTTAATYNGAPPRPQHLRAYNLWHHRDAPLRDICAALRSRENPLAESTVM